MGTGTIRRISAWVNPSPNMRSFKSAMLYPGLCLMESSKNWSVGRGTDAPFEQVGADFVGGRELAAYLNRRLIPGIRVCYPTSFTPTESVFKGVTGWKACVRVYQSGNARRHASGARTCGGGAEAVSGEDVDFALRKRLVGSDDVIRRITAAEVPRTIQESFQDADRDAFAEMRARYLLYY